MSTLQTLREPKAKRRRSKSVPQNVVEVDKPETAQDRYDRWCRECDERRKQAVETDEEPLTMEEIVDIVKDVRAEIYAEEQAKKNTARS